MPEFKLNGTIYDIPEDIVDQFKKDNPNAVAAGKTSPPKEDNQGVPAEVNVAPEIQPTVTELPSADISLDLPKVKTDTVDSTIDIKEKKDDTYRYLGSLVSTIGNVPRNIDKQVKDVKESITIWALDVFDIDENLSRKERLEKVNKFFEEIDPYSEGTISGLPGFGVIENTATARQMRKIITAEEDKQIKTNYQSFSEAAKNGKIGEAAYLAAKGLIQSAPSLAFSSAGLPGMIAHGVLISGEKLKVDKSQAISQQARIERSEIRVTYI